MQRPADFRGAICLALTAVLLSVNSEGVYFTLQELKGHIIPAS